MQQWRFLDKIPWPCLRGQNILNDLRLERKTSNLVLKSHTVEVKICKVTNGHIALCLNFTALTPPAQAKKAKSFSYVVVLDAIPPDQHANEKMENVFTLQSLYTLFEESGNGYRKIKKMTSFPTPSKPQSIASNTMDDPIENKQIFGKVLHEEHNDVLYLDPPFLTSRHQLPIVDISFSSSKQKNNVSSLLSSGGDKLFCFVVQRDGFVFLWQWQHQFYQWKFLNRFNFLENQNLKWTLPVLKFSVCDIHREAGDAKGCKILSSEYEIAWWSVDDRVRPSTSFREISIAEENLHSSSTRNMNLSNKTFESRILVGNAISMEIEDICELSPCKIGLWIRSESSIILRSALAISQRLLSLRISNILNNTKNCSPTILFSCVHSITSELALLLSNGEVKLCRPSKNGSSLECVHLSVLSSWKKYFMAEGSEFSSSSILDFAVHRRYVMLLLNTQCLVYDCSSGVYLFSVSTPFGSNTWKFWLVLNSGANIGIWSPISTVFYLSIGNEKQNITYLKSRLEGATNKDVMEVCKGENNEDNLYHLRILFNYTKSYGPSYTFECVSYALKILQNRKFCEKDDSFQKVFKYVNDNCENPAILMSVVNENLPFFDVIPHELVSQLESIILNGSLILKSKSADIDKFSTEEHIQINKYLTQMNTNLSQLFRRWLYRVDYFKKLSNELSTISADRRYVLSDSFEALTNQKSHRDFPRNFTRRSSNYDFRRMLSNLSCLRLTALSLSSSFGAELLSQLELLLMENDTPSHLLFHSERVLIDVCTTNLNSKLNGGGTSVSKHMYFEIMCRLYYEWNPTRLQWFLDKVSNFCPKIISLKQLEQQRLRSHSERLLCYLPNDSKIMDESRKNLAFEKFQSRFNVLFDNDFYFEAFKLALDIHEYSYAVERFKRYQSAKGDSDEIVLKNLYSLLLGYSVEFRNANEIKELINAKPVFFLPFEMLAVVRKSIGNRNTQAIGYLPVHLIRSFVCPQ